MRAAGRYSGILNWAFYPRDYAAHYSSQFWRKRASATLSQRPSMFRIFHASLSVAIIALAGCGGLVAEKPVATAIAVQKPVEVAVLVKCMTAADIPALPTTVFDKTEQDPEKLALAAKIDLAEYRLWVVAADAQMRRCAEQPEPKK